MSRSARTRANLPGHVQAKRPKTLQKVITHPPSETRRTLEALHASDDFARPDVRAPPPTNTPAELRNVKNGCRDQKRLKTLWPQNDPKQPLLTLPTPQNDPGKPSTHLLGSPAGRTKTDPETTPKTGAHSHPKSKPKTDHKTGPETEANWAAKRAPETSASEALNEGSFQVHNGGQTRSHQSPSAGAEVNPAAPAPRCLRPRTGARPATTVRGQEKGGVGIMPSPPE